MKTKFHIINILLLAAVLLASCNLPTAQAGEGLALTAAAQTVQALISATPGLPIPTTQTSIPGAASPTFTPLPTISANTNTPAATATTNCNVAQFVTDVTIPDGTILTPNQNFAKKWRIKNIGSCTWTGFTLTFDSGDSMSGPATQAIAVVNPGQEIDLEVSLKAPGSVGNYRGYWRIVTNGGVLVPVVNGYQGKSFYVDIKVQNPVTATYTPPALPPAIAQVVLTGLTGEDGFVTSGGATNQNPNVGDNNSNEAVQAFVSFDMSVIPSGANIVKVEVNFGDFDTLGNPWSLSDGCLRAFAQNYGTVDSGDYTLGDPVGAYIRWCGSGELGSTFVDDDMKSLVQSLVGSSRLQLRLQFKSPNPNPNNDADMVRFGTIKLIVTYQ
jgi:predicted small secreted protein